MKHATLVYHFFPGSSCGGGGKFWKEVEVMEEGGQGGGGGGAGGGGAVGVGGALALCFEEASHTHTRQLVDPSVSTSIHSIS